MSVPYVTKHAASRIYFLKQLKRSSVDPDDLYHFYTTVIRPILEYACPGADTPLGMGGDASPPHQPYQKKLQPCSLFAGH